MISLISNTNTVTLTVFKVKVDKLKDKLHQQLILSYAGELTLTIT